MFANSKSKLTPAESASHLGLWAILKAPLLLSTSIVGLTGTWGVGVWGGGLGPVLMLERNPRADCAVFDRVIGVCPQIKS